MTAAAPAIATRRRDPASSGWQHSTIRGLAFTYLAVLLVIPLLVIVQDGLHDGLGGVWSAISKPVAANALWLTLWTAAVMAILNGIMGTLTAFVLVRYSFPGKTALNAIVDLPFAIPTLITGVMLVTLYGPQQAVGSWLANTLNFKIVFAPPGIILALMFITFPFVVRTVQPVLLNMDMEQERAAATIGATSWETFRLVTLPALLLPLTSGTLLGFARAIGEFGAIVVVAGNIPMKSQTIAVYVYGQVESSNRAVASSVSVVLMALAFTLVLVVDRLQKIGEER